MTQEQFCSSWGCLLPPAQSALPTLLSILVPLFSSKFPLRPKPIRELQSMSLHIRGRITLNFPISFRCYSLNIYCRPLLKMRTRVGCSRPLARSHTADCVFTLLRIINTSLCHSPPFVCFSAPFPEAKKKNAAQRSSWKFSHQMLASIWGLHPVQV